MSWIVFEVNNSSGRLPNSQSVALHNLIFSSKKFSLIIFPVLCVLLLTNTMCEGANGFKRKTKGFVETILLLKTSQLWQIWEMRRNYRSASPSVRSNATPNTVESRLRLMIWVARDSRSVKPDSFPPSSIRGLTPKWFASFSISVSDFPKVHVEINQIDRGGA